jgi:hypothetical protein
MPVGAFLVLARVRPDGGKRVSGMVAGSQSVDRYNDRAPELCGEVGDEFPVCGLDFVDVGANVHATGLRSEPSVADDPESSSGRRFATREHAVAERTTNVGHDPVQ